MRTGAGAVAALVLVCASAMTSDTARHGTGWTAGRAVESSSRWTLRYAAREHADFPLSMFPSADGGVSLFIRKRPGPGWSMLRWDGTSWRRAGLPAQFAKAWGLEIGGSPSGETIWAAVSVSQKYDTVAEHLWRFSGGRWTRLLSRDATWNGVIDISVDSRGGAWFVTGMDPDGAPSTVLRWSGNAWPRQPSPPDFDLTAVAAAGPDDAWIVSRERGDRTLHWDGASWKDVPYPCAVDSARPPCRGRSYLGDLDLAVRPDGQAWAAGPYWADGGSPVVLHWDRTRWAQVGTDLTRTGLTAVRVDREGGVWMAARPASGAPYVLTLRDGGWTRFTLPAGGPGEQIVGIAPVRGTTRLWVHTRRPDPTGGGTTSLVYELS
ncbi:hypothetical protein [Microbispora hainanensis]|uniref:Exo-alpha-sialidase n=1 Tax=Microbispora hainanensis TaxID=568844 RepID=A0A544Y2F0_9ACTN|nr:hypothetical protein [Microbispora hainanensis]TQS10940.1 hypothetical protein FLX08_37755 [Microbispora hainanensis]